MVRCWACKRSFVTSVGGKCILGSTCGTFSIKNFLPPMPTLYSNKILRRAKIFAPTFNDDFLRTNSTAMKVSMWKWIVFQAWNSTWFSDSCGVVLEWREGWLVSKWNSCCCPSDSWEEKCSATSQPTKHTATGNFLVLFDTFWYFLILLLLL